LSSRVASSSRQQSQRTTVSTPAEVTVFHRVSLQTEQVMDSLRS
jgi:hypothetical protein